ncbi:hypothetical protein J6I39_09135 [bacterium]|nr:hypothetical protein [bacterium]
MVDSNFYVENSANNPMHYGDKPRVGVIDFPDRLPVKRPFNYFEAQALYNNLTHDMWVQQEHANPERVKKGVPKIIKIALGLIVTVPLIFMGVKGIQKIIAKFKH